MTIQAFAAGKLVLVLLVFMSFGKDLRAQVFDVQFYFEWDKNETDFTLASLHQISDTLASIEFRSSYPKNRAYFACSYFFRNDTLFINEISETIETLKEVELGPFYREISEDSLYLRYDPEQWFDTKPAYEQVFFEINGNYYYKSERCFTDYCAIARKPKEREFQIKIWSGKELLDTYDIGIYNLRNIVWMRRIYFGSSRVFQPISFYESKFPPRISYNEKEYVLQVRLQSKEFHETKLTVEK